MTATQKATKTDDLLLLNLSDAEVEIARRSLDRLVECLTPRLSADRSKRELRWDFPTTVAMLSAMTLDWQTDQEDGGLSEQADELLQKLQHHAGLMEELQDDASRPGGPFDPASIVPPDLAPRYEVIAALTDKYCDEYLDDDYRQSCRRMAAEVCTPGTPAVRGKPESWAAGVAAAVGWVNDLTNPSNDLHVSTEELAKWFGVSVPTVYAKLKTIREGLNLLRYDPLYTPPGAGLRLRSGLPAELHLEGMDSNAFVSLLEACLEGLTGEHAPEEPYVVHHARVQDDRKRGAPKGTALEQATGFQLKITLDETKPAIWRRVVVRDCTLGDLHEVIQDAMGWHDGHLHEFVHGDERFVMAADEEFGVEIDEDEESYCEDDVLLSDLAANGVKSLRYWYDFGDDWWHTIKFEKSVELGPDAPLAACTGGAMACPPEDIGGVWGFYDFLNALDDPKHERHQEFIDWHGGAFDPNAFDADEVNELLFELSD